MKNDDGVGTKRQSGRGWDVMMLETAGAQTGARNEKNNEEQGGQ